MAGDLGADDVDSASTESGTDVGVPPEDIEQLRGHDDPDEGFAENDAPDAESRDDEEREKNLAYELYDTGDERKDLLAEALEGVSGDDEYAEHGIERLHERDVVGAIVEDL